MASVTTWVRLEPTVRRPDPQCGLEARIHDPLWMLGRQWQLAAFEAEDGGSPVSAAIDVSVEPICRYHAGALPPSRRASGKPYDPTSAPLEAVVEREARRTDGRGQPGIVPTTRESVEGGLQFLRHLEHAGMAHYRVAFTAAFPMRERGADDDPDSARYLGMLASRVPDGADLARDMAPFKDEPALPPHLPAGLVIEPADWPAVRAALDAWLVDYRTHYSEPEEGAGSAWVDDRLEYAFAISAFGARESTYVADEYHGGRLDWYAFDRDATASLGTRSDDAAPRRVALSTTVIPSPLAFPGMPAARWWEFEDARVDFGSMDAGGEDLLRMLFVDFALNFGNDWFLVPLDVPVGVIARISRLLVTDSFGQTIAVQPTSQLDTGTPWRVFQVDGDGAGLLVCPALGPGLAGEPIEEVRFLRDEMANLAWAVEVTVEGLDGRAVDRHLAEHRGAVTPPERPLAAEAELRYRFQTSVPPHWIPLMPAAAGPERLLNVGEMLADNEDQRATRRLGRILGQDPSLRVHDEEVPREGAFVTRGFQYARWTDGSVHAWVGRQRRPGQGEGSSGLAFDVVKSGRTSS